MYKELFNCQKQNAMRSFFLEVMAPLGKKKCYKKNEIVDIPLKNYVGILTSGKVKVELISAQGMEKVLYFLKQGEIFGETTYFTGGKFNTMVKTTEATTISIIDENTLDNFLKDYPEAYRFFIHSIMRKYNISISQMSDILFNPSDVKVASTLYRLAVQSAEKVDDKYIIDIPMTHQELADLIGCSRITVTKVLKEFKSREIIDIVNRKIIIYNLENLKKWAET
jgi:CRP/FNR family transcriptional regulator, cyclic AMP receptor protein